MTTMRWTWQPNVYSRDSLVHSTIPSRQSRNILTFQLTLGSTFIEAALASSNTIRARSTMDIKFESVVPILRIFDIAKADEFCRGYLGFKIDWDHRFDDNAPLDRQVSRGGLVLHLS